MEKLEDFLDYEDLGNPEDLKNTIISEEKYKESLGSNDPKLLKSIIEDFKKYIGVLKDRMQKYTRKLSNNEEAFQNFFETRSIFMEKLQEKEENMKDDQNDLEKKTKEEIDNLKIKREEEIINLEQELKGQLEFLRHQNLVLTESIKSKENDVEKERKLIEEKNQLNAQLDTVRIKNVDEKIKLNMEKESEWAKLKEEKEVLIRTRKHCEEKKIVTYDKKKQFEDDKHEHMKHLDFLKLERNKILQQNKIAQQNLAKNEEGLLEFQTLTFKQSQKIKELKDEIKILNEKFPEEVAKYTKEQEFMKFDNQNKKSELEFRYQNLSDVLRIKHRETRSIRRTLQLIMDQRSEIEHFVIEAIQEINMDKENISVFDKDQVSQTGSIQGSNKSINQNSLYLNNNVGRSEKVLKKKKFDWDEREKVLRVIFAKLNAGEIPIFWREIDITELKTEILGKDKSHGDSHMRTGDNFNKGTIEVPNEEQSGEYNSQHNTESLSNAEPMLDTESNNLV